MQPAIGYIEPCSPPELAELEACTRLLDLCEYRIFQAAYRAWYGREPSEADLRPGFAGYLRGLRLPPWVRHYCRQVIAEAQADGRLPDSTAAHTAGEDPGLTLVAGLCLLLLALLVLA